jgi:hypothetical protein
MPVPSEVKPGPRLAAALLALAFLGGCGFLSGEAAPAPGTSMFTDVPLPSELEVDQKKSQVFESAQGRVGTMKAQGRVKAEAVENYYREAMPQNGWSLDSEFGSGETLMLVFGKAPRSAAVKVTPGWIDTDLEINVSAKK